MFGYLLMPILVPWALSNHLRMDAAIIVLMRLMEKGKAGATVKYDTAQKAWATFTVLWESSLSSRDNLTLSAGSVKGRFVATLCPSKGQWYQHFETGISARMGDVVTKDRAYTIEVLLVLVEMYEHDWQTYHLQMLLLSLCAFS
jgi:hypothetical protein